MKQAEEMPQADPRFISEHVRESLKKYGTHTKMACLECGYVGLMGVKKSTKPWYLSWWIFIIYAVAFAPIGWIFILAFVMAGMFSTKRLAECPSCGAELISRQYVL